MKKIVAIVFVALAGCATKTRSLELKGMYASEAGTVAIGSVEVMSAPEGEESASLQYSEDTAWLSPSTKTHKIKVMLTGTNSVEQLGGIVSSICGVFASDAPGRSVKDDVAAFAAVDAKKSEVAND